MNHKEKYLSFTEYGWWNAWSQCYTIDNCFSNSGQAERFRTCLKNDTLLANKDDCENRDLGSQRENKTCKDVDECQNGR